MRVEKFIENFAQTLLALLFSILFVSSFLFFFDINISSANYICAFLLSWAILVFFNKAPFKTLAYLILCTIFICFSFNYASGYTDYSFDGVKYHIPAVKQLAHGWNPFDINKAFIAEHEWIKYFSKGSWIIEATLINTFTKHSAWGAKSLNFILSICALFMTYSALTKLKVSNKVQIKWLLAFLCVYNTICLGQMHTFMVDGNLSCCIIILISSLIIWLKNKTTEKLSFLCMAICLLLSIKLSAIAYTLIIIAGGFLFVCNKEKKKYAISTLFTFVFALVVLNFNPICTNFYKFKNPIYPIGSKNIEILPQKDVPLKLRGKNTVKKFIISTYSQVSNNEDVILKNPLSITKNEGKCLNHETRVCGYGILWGLIFSLSLIVTLFLYKEKDFKNFLAVVALLFLSVFINPECWWARFVPQAWLFPIFVCSYALKKKHKKLAFVLILAMSLNFCLYFIVRYL